jgi:hypothetical protein
VASRPSQEDIGVVQRRFCQRRPDPLDVEEALQFVFDLESRSPTNVREDRRRLIARRQVDADDRVPVRVRRGVDGDESSARHRPAS